MALASSIFKGSAEGIRKILDPAFKDVSSFSFLYDSPADVNPTTPGALSIFLYSIAPNNFLRNTGSTILSRNSSNASIRAQDMLLDLYFMITAYAQTKDTEYAILERVIQMLNDNPVIQGGNLSQGLIDNGNSDIRIEPIHVSMDELNKLWSIFPNKSYRLSVFYLLNPVRMISTRIETVPAISGVGG
jgi:hypothetical protein